MWEVYKGVLVIVGGVEVLLWWFVYYDYWSDKVCRFILMDSKVDFVVFGMGENLVVEIVWWFVVGDLVKDFCGMWGVVYVLGVFEKLLEDVIMFFSYEEVVSDKFVFFELMKIIYYEINLYNVKWFI